MRRSTIFLIVFIIIAGAIVGVSQLLRTQPPVELTVIVDPLGAAWVRDAVTAFNASENTLIGTQRIQFVVSEVSDVAVWRGQETWNVQSHPTVWIPSSSISLSYAGLPFEQASPSAARTLLVWGGYASRLNVLTEDDPAALDWAALQAGAAADGGSWSALGGQANWGFLRVAIAPPESSMAGVAALFSAAAAYADTPTLNGAITADSAFRAWLLPVVQTVPSNVTNNPAAYLSQSVGNAQIALAPESQWLTSSSALLNASDPLRFAYPVQQFLFDFPVVYWDDNTTTSEQRQAAAALAEWLTSSAQQANAEHFGLRPANGIPAVDSSLFAAATANGIQTNIAVPTPIQAPSRNEVQGLIQWYTQNR